MCCCTRPDRDRTSMQVGANCPRFSQRAHASLWGRHFPLTSRTDSTRVRLRDSHRQHSMNPPRRQPTTACGCAIMSARFELDQNRRKASQRKLSEVSGISFRCRAFKGQVAAASRARDFKISAKQNKATGWQTPTEASAGRIDGLSSITDQGTLHAMHVLE